MSCTCSFNENCKCFTPVQVIWWDTNESSDSGWVSKAEAVKTKPCKIKSIGYLINQTDDFITFAADIDGHDNSEDKDDLLGRVETFPKGCVVDISYLS